MSLADYLGGVVLLLLVLGGVLWGSWVLVRKRYPQLVGASRIIALGVLSALGLLVVHMLPGALGVLGRGSVLVVVAAWVVVAWRIPATQAEAEPPPDPVPADQLAARVLAGVVLALAAVYAFAVARNQLTLAATGVDATNFHLPGVVDWIHTGSIWTVSTFVPDWAFGNYPNNGDVLVLSTVLPWHNDFLARFALWPFWALTGVAVYAIARELRVPPASAIVAAGLVLVMPVVAVPTMVTGLIDALMLFGFGAGVLFLLRHHRSGRRSELVLGGIALGLSFGTKWYAVSSVAIVLVVWALARWRSGISPGVVLRQAAGASALIGACGGFWMLRNLVESGNPVYPVKVAPLGVTVFDAPHDVPRDQAGQSLVHYLGDADVWSDSIVHAFRDRLAAPAGLIALGACLAGVLLIARFIRRRQGSELPSQAVAATLLVATGVLAVAYAVTPYTAGGPEGLPVLAGPNSRYLTPALLVAAPLAAWAAVQFRRGAPVFGLLGLLAVLDGVRVGSNGQLGVADVYASNWAVGAAAAGLLAVAGWLAYRYRPWAAAAVAGVGALALVAAGHEVQQRFNDGRYQGIDEAVDWVVRFAPADRRIGLAGARSPEGIGPAFPAFGPRYENEVSYVGELDQHTIRRFGSRNGFLAAVRNGGYDILVVGRDPFSGTMVDEERWALSAGYEQVARSNRLTAFIRRG